MCQTVALNEFLGPKQIHRKTT